MRIRMPELQDAHFFADIENDAEVKNLLAARRENLKHVIGS
jgi:hypothetical protein